MTLPVIFAGRRNAESLMLDTCTVRRKGTTTTPDPETGAPIPVWDVVYTGKAKRQSQTLEPNTTDVGESLRTTVRYQAHFPVGAFVPQVGDVIEWTACPLDPDRVGTRDRVLSPFAKSLATAMRLDVEQEV